MPPRSRRRVLGAVAAFVLAGALGLSPQAAGTATAAEELRVAADATYTLDPEAGRVHVEIDVTATNLKPSSASFVYFWRTIGFPLQAEASGIGVSGGASSIATTRGTGFIEAEVRLRANLYYRETTRFTIRYDLVGGAPRSTSPTRVGSAFSTFGVWAWGDPGRGTVEVHTPSGFINRTFGSSMGGNTGSDGSHLRASPANPFDFFAIIESENRDAYSETRISFDGGVEIVVLAWPEDDAWDELVAETMRKGIPELRELIALPWPVDHDLDVRQRYTPALEGYAGVFFTDDERIDVSEDLDPVVILHEASHAWFNGALFSERWIYEGLAEEYAWRALTAAGLEPGTLPVEPELFDPGWQALVQWEFPEVIRDQDTDDEERYGYNASFWVVHQIVETVGVEQMATAFAAAEADLTAYPGAGPPETVAAEDDWRRFLDLVEPLDGPDTLTLDEAVKAWVMTTLEAQLFALRAEAREEYRSLLDAGDGWRPPWSVRALMGTWSFAGARSEIDKAMAVLDLRDRVDAAAQPLELRPDGAVRAAYEGGGDGLSGATVIAEDQLEALAAIAATKVRLDATPDLLSQIGLIGETPRVPYEAARTAFEAGDLEAATTHAGAAAAVIAGAAAIGQQRILATLAVILGLIALALLVRLIIRRRRRHAVAHATATLAADPAAAPASPITPPPDDSGGSESGDSPADP